LEDRVEQLARLLGVPVGEELHGALEVGEQDRDLLALPFEGRLRGEDLLGEMPGGVGLRRREARLGGISDRGAALAAELVAGRVRRAAGGASRGERGAALAAELLPGWIRVLAARTRRHHEASGAARLALTKGGVNGGLRDRDVPEQSGT